MYGSVEEKWIFLIGNTSLPRLTWKSIRNYIDLSQSSKHIWKIFLPQSTWKYICKSGRKFSFSQEFVADSITLNFFIINWYISFKYEH